MAESGADFIGFGFEDLENGVPTHNPAGNPLDYGRQNEKPRYQSVDLLVSLPTPVWVPQGKRYSDDLLQMLHEEINDYVAWMSPSEAEHKLRILTIARLRNVVRKIWPAAEMSVFGSFETRLYLPSSDVDIVILEPSIPLESKSWLKPLEAEIRRAKLQTKLEAISTARVPLIKYTDELTGYNVDISMNMTGGIESARIVKEFLSDPACAEGLKPLLLILKQFLSQNGLNEVFSGGLGSYALLSMVACFLKMHPMLYTRKMRAGQNLGILLMEFLEFYGKFMNVQRAAVYVLPNGEARHVAKQHRIGGRVSQLQVIQILDPQNNGNDISGGSYQYNWISLQFKFSFNILNAIIGRGFEIRDAERDGARRHRRPLTTTMLGNIIGLKREVIDQRDDIQAKCDEMEAEGTLTSDDFEDLAKRYEVEGGIFPVTITPGDADRRAAAIHRAPVHHDARRNGNWRDQKNQNNKRSAVNEYHFVSDNSDSDGDEKNLPVPRKKAKLNGGGIKNENGKGSYHRDFRTGASGSSMDPVVVDDDGEDEDQGRDYYGRKR
ncbi:hypothetical protein HK097_008903 [Rhizophlyctis rosea]|uniref:polynucleotide adenylyltransferase n=1 Tax=Rhizophlyctis rosea TaxID=64517 RepID=A0AAD5X3N2_9FUNG|nr:hypothetical protein HK097_008903 [Rhizophlyctis rosea]